MLLMDRESTFPDRTYRRVLEHINTAVVFLNRKMEINYINPAAEMLFEIGRRKAIGKKVEAMINLPESLVQRIEASLTNEHQFSEREFAMRVSHSKLITVDCTVSTVHDANVADGLLLEFLQIDRQLRITREENLIVQQNVSKKLLRGLSHEIKNPLGGIRGAAQLLGEELDSDNLREYTNVIIEEADRLNNLVDRMLGPSRIRPKESINIHEVLERVYALISIEAEVTQIEIKRDYDPSIPDFIADAEQLIQAVLNLAKNAIEALNGAGKILIRSRTQRQFTIGNNRHKLVIVIEIIDNGPGIPLEIADKLFFPMITGRADGTGLGLSIAQSIVNRHGGVIECQSQPGNTVFQVLLPLEQINAK